MNVFHSDSSISQVTRDALDTVTQLRPRSVAMSTIKIVAVDIKLNSFPPNWAQKKNAGNWVEPTHPVLKLSLHWEIAINVSAL